MDNHAKPSVFTALPSPALSARTRVSTSVLTLVLLVLFLHSRPVAAEQLVIAIRTFIPDAHPTIGDYMKPVPGNPALSMLPDAPGPSQCFATDSRGFSTDLGKSSRFGGQILVDTKTKSVTVSPIFGTTVEYDCTSGKIVCTEQSGGGAFRASHTVSGDTISIDYTGEASNPCLTIAPDIEFSGRLTVDTAGRSVSLSGFTDVFPAFEAVLVTGGKAQHLFMQDPAAGATPAGLLTSKADRPVKSGKIPY